MLFEKAVARDIACEEVSYDFAIDFCKWWFSKWTAWEKVHRPVDIDEVQEAAIYIYETDPKIIYKN